MAFLEGLIDGEEMDGDVRCRMRLNYQHKRW